MPSKFCDLDPVYELLSPFPRDLQLSRVVSVESSSFCFMVLILKCDVFFTVMIH